MNPRKNAKPRKPKAGQGPLSMRVVMLPTAKLRSSPENAELYRPVLPSDDEVVKLAASIRQRGVRQPLEVTADRYIVSGHRRHCAATLAGLAEVPCVVLDKRRADMGRDAYVTLLREHNRQRSKSFAEQVREAAVDADPEAAYAGLVKRRAEQRERDDAGEWVDAGDYRGRKRISAAKRPMLDAARAVIDDWRDTWPVSVRRVHYALLNAPPLRHAGKPGSRYRNDGRCYKDLCDLLARARISGEVPMHAIDDETRPVRAVRTFRGVGGYVEHEVGRMLTTYWRDLLQGQPRHVELVGEKNTVLPILRPVADRFTVPLTIGRGYTSVPPRQQIVSRYRASGKDGLVLLVASDHDPEGCDIPETLARSIRDDFGVAEVEAYKVALTAQQVAELDLPAAMDAKPTSSRYRRFVERHGTQAYELEAMPPGVLAAEVTKAIEAVLDVEAFNAEQAREKRDEVKLDALRGELPGLVREAVGMLDDPPHDDGETPDVT